MEIDELEVERFLFESNKIDEIYLVSPLERLSAATFLRAPAPTIPNLESYVHAAHGESNLREWENLNRSEQLSIQAPLSGPNVRETLSLIMHKAAGNLQTPFELHVEYMALSPFSYGNGQSGRLLWLWQMYRFYPKRNGSFLGCFYRQAISEC